MLQVEFGLSQALASRGEETQREKALASVTASPWPITASVSDWRTPADGDAASARNAAMWQSQRVRQSMPFVRQLARLLFPFTPPSVEVEDLIHVGTIALVEADRRYSESSGAAFESYARTRIRGAMLDELSTHRRRQSTVGADYA